MYSQKRHMITAIPVLLAMSMSGWTPPVRAQPALAQASSALVGLTVGQIIESFEKSILSIIAGLDDSVSKNSFQIRQHLLLLLDNVKVSSEDILDQTFEDLSSAQKQLFTDVERSIWELQHSGEHLLIRAQQTIDSLNDALGTLPGSDQRPRVLRFSPVYMVGTPDATPSREVVIEGSWLGRGEPTLVIGSQSCSRLTRTETKLVFSCPTNLFSAHSTKVVQRQATLTVHGASSLLGHKRPATYELGIFLVPSLLGTVRVTALVESAQRITQTRSQSFSAHNEHCQGRRTMRWNVNATSAQWRIDPRTIATKTNFLSRDSRFEGANDVTEHGFQLVCEVRNHGRCVFGTGDARGACGVTVTFTEYQTRTEQRTEQLAPVEVHWGRDTLIRLPEGTKEVITTLERIDGGRAINSTSDGWARMDRDIRSRTVIIRPLPIHDALR